MLRRVAHVAVLGLLLAPSAAAWTQLPGATGLVNIVQPATLRTAAGSELEVFTDTKSSLFLVRNGTLKTLLSGMSIVGKPAVVQQPNGALQLYVSGQGGGLDGVGRLTSTDDGVTWTGPIATKSKDLADVGAAAVRPDGTPLFTQSGTGFVNVYEGLNGESVTNIFTGCCGYAGSVAVDAANIARVAFWSNATAAPNRFVLQQLGGATRTFGTQTPSFSDRVPLFSSGKNTWLMWADGYPVAKSLIFQNLASPAVKLDGNFTSGADPHMAIAAEPDGSVWALWTRDGAVRAERSRTHGATFGALVTTALPVGQSVAYQLEALARPGSVEAFVNLGSTLVHTKILPGLTVRATRKLATVLDDSFPVKGAHVGTKTTDAKGHVSIANIKAHTFLRVTAAGYTPTGFRVP